MATFPSKGSSLWIETTSRTQYAPLANDTHVDVAVIGGGITGLTTAYLLKQQGKRVAVFEKEHIGAGISGFTTGKVTSQHGVTYSSLIKQFGEAVARDYGTANQAAITKIEEIITREMIDCDWRREANYVFTEEVSKVEELKQEAHDAARLGLPASFVPSLPLSIGAQGAVRFDDQATFHIGKYLAGLARAIDGQGSRVYEKGRAFFIRDGEPAHCRVNGHKVTADEIVIATNVPAPVPMHTAYAFLEYPTRSYIVAGRIKEDIEGMYINTDKPSRSILPAVIDGQRWLLIGGDGHIVGKTGPSKGHYDKLERYAKERFGVEKIEYRWTTWDYVAYDNLPLIGKAYPWSHHLYVANGFRKWGLTNGTVAAMILSDTLVGRANPWAHTFRSNRLSALTSLPKGLIQGIRQ